MAAAPISDVREPARNVPPLALGLIAAISVLWGLNWPVMKLAVGELSPWTFRVICVLVSGVGLLLVAWVSGDRLTLPRRYWPSLLFVAIFNVTGWNLLSYCLVALVAWFVGQRMRVATRTPGLDSGRALR